MDLELRDKLEAAKQNAVVVEITEAEKERLRNFTESSRETKMKEGGYRRDSHNFGKRGITGKIGELAVFEMLGYGMDDLDLTIGNSADYNVPDLACIGFNAGIKSSTTYNAPLIPLTTDYGQIICYREENVVYILGYATPEVLSNPDNRSVELVRDPNARDHKIAFIGFDQLIPITNLMDALAVIPRYEGKTA